MPNQEDKSRKPAHREIKRVGKAPADEEKTGTPSVTEEPVPVVTEQENPTAMPDAGEGPKDTDVAPEPLVVRGGEKKTDALGFTMKIGGILLAVCAVVTLMLSLANALTEKRIAENKQNDMNAAIKEIFENCDASAPEEGTYAEPVTAVYRVLRGEAQIGYAVSVIASGFGGDIEMMVGIAPGGSVAGVRIISLSETPGVGNRVADEGYLSGYAGKGGKLTLGSEIDGVAGATISSKAVLAGVNAALALKLQVEGAEDIEPSESETVDTDTPIPADSSLAVIPLPQDVTVPLSVETVYREETKAPETEPEESRIVEIVTEPNRETEPPESEAATDAPTEPAETTDPAVTVAPTETTLAP